VTVEAGDRRDDPLAVSSSPAGYSASRTRD